MMDASGNPIIWSFYTAVPSTSIIQNVNEHRILVQKVIKLETEMLEVKKLLAKKTIKKRA